MVADAPRSTALFYPVVLGVGVALASIAIATGIPAGVVVAVITIGGAVTVALAEHRRPFRGDWLDDHKDTQTDLLHLMTSLAVAEALMRGTALTIAGMASGSALNLWPSHWPLAVQVLMALFFTELTAYIGHRALHALPVLWRFHRIHHSAPRLYWLNSSRNHPVDVLVSTAITVVPLVIVGAGIQVITLCSVIVTLHLLMQHSNVHMAAGPLDWLFATAPVHRFHHDPTRNSHNYGHVLSIFDWMAGTFRAPSHHQPPLQIGVQDGVVPDGWWAQVRLPFRSSQNASTVAEVKNPSAKPAAAASSNWD